MSNFHGPTRGQSVQSDRKRKNMLPTGFKTRPDADAGHSPGTAPRIRNFLIAWSLRLLAPAGICIPTVAAILAIDNPAIKMASFRFLGWARVFVIGLLFAESAISIVTLFLCRLYSKDPATADRDADRITLYSTFGLAAAAMASIILIAGNSRFGAALFAGGFFSLLAFGGWGVLIVAGPWPICTAVLFGGMVMPLVPYLYFYYRHADVRGDWPELTAIILAIPYIILGILCFLSTTGRPSGALLLMSVLAPMALLFSLPISLYAIVHGRRKFQPRPGLFGTRSFLAAACWVAYAMPVAVTTYATHGLALIPWVAYFSTLAGVVLVLQWIREVLASRR